MSASIALSDFCREPRAIHGTISEVAGMPMPRTEGTMLKHCCCRLGSKCAAKEVRTKAWDSRIFNHGQLGCRFNSDCSNKKGCFLGRVTYQRSHNHGFGITPFLICTSLGYWSNER